MSELIKTALFTQHEALGAKMVEYSGFTMPVSYSGLSDEHLSVRTDVGMFDVSHMGEFSVDGPDALAFIQQITTNDVNTLVDGKIQYSCMPNGNGGIVDDLLVYRFTEDSYLLVVNAGNKGKDWVWVNEKASEGGFNVDIKDNSNLWALIALQGPNASAALKPLVDEGGIDPEKLKYYTFTKGEIMGADCIISATGYTGSGGFELYIPNSSAGKIWEALIDGGVKPCGLGARDTLRMEMGYCLYGNDINETTNPIEAGLGWITKFTNAFIDSDLLQQIKTDGPTRRLVGLKILKRGIPRKDYEVVSSEGEVVGVITSGTMSPSLGIGIGMAYIDSSFSKKGTELAVRIRNKDITAEVVRFPFLKLA